MHRNWSEFPTITFVGFGEAAHAISCGWAHSGTSPVLAYDIGLASEDTQNLILKRCVEARAEPQRRPDEAISGAGLIFSLVTADQALQAAIDCAPFLRPGSLWLDGNSCAPQTKIKAASVIEATGANYIDMAIMAPVYPKRHEVPLLLAGAETGKAAALLETLGMRPVVAGPRVGQASSIKMLRSVMIKGLEALTSECLLAARRAGVEAAVIASLQSSDPGIDWQTRASYNLERMLVHGARRAAEMEEVCATLQGLGLPDWMSRGTVEWQQRLSRLGVEPGEDAFEHRADNVLQAL